MKKALKSIMVILIIFIFLDIILPNTTLLCYLSPKPKLYRADTKFDFDKVLNANIDNLDYKTFSMFEKDKVVDNNINIFYGWIDNKRNNSIIDIEEFRFHFKEGYIDVNLYFYDKKIDVDKIYAEGANEDFNGRIFESLHDYSRKGNKENINEDAVIPYYSYNNPAIFYNKADKYEMNIKYKHDTLCILYQQMYYPKGFYADDTDGWISYCKEKYMNRVFIVKRNVTIQIISHWKDKTGLPVMNDIMNKFFSKIEHASSFPNDTFDITDMGNSTINEDEIYEFTLRDLYSH